MEASFVLYKASAGSGKTFTLVKEYLKLALSDTQSPFLTYRSILATTFTNKAATEMKERVIKSLKEMAEPGASPFLLSVLATEMKEDEWVLKQRAAILLKEILHHYADFSIGTIDSFVYKIIKAFAFELEIPLHFSLEMNMQDILTRCVEDLIALAGVENGLTQILQDYVEQQAEEQKKWDPVAKMVAVGMELLQDKNNAFVQDLVKMNDADLLDFSKEMARFIRAFEAELSQGEKEFSALFEKSPVTEGDLYQKKNGVLGLFSKIKQKRFVDAVGKTACKMYEEDLWFGKLTKAREQELAGEDLVMKECFKKVMRFYLDGIERYVIYKNLTQHFYMLRLMQRVQQLVQDYKAEHHCVMMSELSLKVNEVINKEPVPFIYEKLGERYKHFLIDEFQDTSVIQWNNMIPLIENGLSEGKFSMLVGDPKQSIYRWRGGEVEQIVALPQFLSQGISPSNRERQGIFEANFEAKNLKVNYRSLSTIIEFNNAFFQRIASVSFGKIYKDFEQSFAPGNNGGLVTISQLDKKNLKDKEEEGELVQVDFSERMCDLTLKWVKWNIDQGYQASDIAVLVRRKYEGKLLAEMLMQNNFQVISGDSLLLAGAEEVMLLEAAMRVLYFPDDVIAGAKLLHYASHHHIIPMEELEGALTRIQGQGTAQRVCKELRKYGLTIHLGELRSFSLYDAVVYLIRVFNLESKNPLYIRFFMDEVHAYQLLNPGNIPGFLKWWDNRKNSAAAVLPEGINAIRIMTIHSSKGLEFPVVIFPFFNWTFSQPDYVWANVPAVPLRPVLLKVNKELKEKAEIEELQSELEQQKLENINLLYVAFTRASRHLHIVSELTAVKENQELTSAAKAVADFLLSVEPVQSGEMEKEQQVDPIWQNLGYKTEEDESLWFSGAISPMEKKHALKMPTEISSKNTVQNWRDAVRIKTEVDLFWGETERDERKEFGIVMHYLLAGMHTLSDLSFAVNKCLREGVLPLSWKDTLLVELDRLLKMPDMAVFFQPGWTVYTEREMLCADGKTIRPDRVMEKSDKVWVVDFKTGKFEKQHLDQINLYKNTLSEIYDVPVSGALIYLEEEKVVWS